MEFIKDLGYKAGFVPPQDVASQKRCYEYLETALTTMKKRLDETPATEADPGTPTGNDAHTYLKNQIRVIERIVHLVESSEGSFGYKKSHMFWEYWDKAKEDAIREAEPELSAEQIRDKIAELEHGRYEPL